ncbi:MAG: iron ABC transporter permease [Verrucomicrobia bacterium]|nr:iron ABC transporter permease [Verrucomicrobiota bacterium]
MMLKKKSLFFAALFVGMPLVLLGCLMAGADKMGIPDLRSEIGMAIFTTRLQSVIAALVVGGGLAVAGVVMQALLRNPLAEPYVLGVSSGAGLGAAIAIVSGIAGLSVVGRPAIAFFFAIVTLLAVYRLAGSGGKLSIYGLILSGVIVSSICSSVLMFIISKSKSDEMHGIIWWMLGSLQPSSLPLLATCSVAMCCGMIVLWALAPELNALSLGQEMAHHVGVRTRMATGIGLAVATLITASAVAMSGLIGFVGLVVPHVVRRLIGPDHRYLLPFSAICGGLFLAVCDAVARTIMAPVGVLTAMVGGPFFLAILRSKRKGWLE